MAQNLTTEKVTAMVNEFVAKYPSAKVSVDTKHYARETMFKVAVTVPDLLPARGNGTFRITDDSSDEMLLGYMKCYLRFYCP